MVIAAARKAQHGEPPLARLLPLQTVSGAPIVPILRLLYRTVCGQFIQPINHACVTATLGNQAL
jgi:hypothetical protein